MQSVGEVMAIGRTFPESLQKAIRSLETGRLGLNCDPVERELDTMDADELVQAAAVPTPDRLFQVEAALRKFVSIERLHEVTGIDPWFLDQMLQIVEERDRLREVGYTAMKRADWRHAKRHGFSDGQLAFLWDVAPEAVRAARLAASVAVTYKTVDTCAAEFAAFTPYHYGTYEDEDELAPLTRDAVMILGSGPNRIGQGVEFDYCCVHAAFALRDAGFETVMVNCNPETVSTDYDTSDRLFFEPLTIEDVLNVADGLQRAAAAGGGMLRGVIVSLGGQTPLKLAHTLEAAGIPILGTAPASIDAAEDREIFNALCDRLGIPQPAGGTATEAGAAVAIAREIGYPVLVRPSYVLGGRAMEIVYDDTDLRRAMGELAHTGSLGREGGLSASRPALVDRFLEDATEVDVDALRDHTGDCVIGGIMEHIEEAGVHSGDSACAIPPPTLPGPVLETIERHTRATRRGTQRRRAPQRAVRGEGRAGVCDRGQPTRQPHCPVREQGHRRPSGEGRGARRCSAPPSPSCAPKGCCAPPAEGGHVAIKEAVLPFNRFPDVDTLLGPEMRSTGEVMGIDRSFGMAFAKSQAGAGNTLPHKGAVFLSLADRDKDQGLVAARRFAALGFSIAATEGTAATLEANHVPVATIVAKVGEDRGRDAVDLISSGEVDLVVNTPRGRGPRADGMHIRRAAIAHGVACVTTVAAAIAAAAGIAEAISREPDARSLQEYHTDGQLRLGV